MFKYEIGDEICFNQSHGFPNTEIGEIISKHSDVFGGNIYGVKTEITFPGVFSIVSEENIIKSYKTKKENLIPEKVIFNREKGKTTLLFKGNGKQDYVSYSSKALEIEKYNAHFGFYITFYKFLNRNIPKKQLRENINSIFELGKCQISRVRLILIGAIEQSLKEKKSYHKELNECFEDILETARKNKGNGTWCYEEFKKKRKEKEFKELRKQELSSEIYKLETKVDKLKKNLEKLNDKRN